MPYKNIEDQKNYQSNYQIKHKDRLKKLKHKYYLEHKKEFKERNLKLLGINLQEYNERFKEQNGVCFICGNPETRQQKNRVMDSLSVDHDHKTNKIRGLLCSRCNTLLGWAKDNPDWLRKAANYLGEEYVQGESKN